MWLNPGHGPALLKLADETGAELVWATTWEHLANEYIGPALGLPKLPVIEWGFKSFHWKYDAVLEYTNGAPFVWFDDQFPELTLERDWFEAKRGPDSRHLLHYVNPKIGLVESDFEAAKIWLRENSV